MNLPYFDADIEDGFHIRNSFLSGITSYQTVPRSRVSHFMNKFRKLGYIESHGKMEIRSPLLNVVFYDKPEIRKRDGSEEPR
jgi:hypothetical protein